MDNESQKVKSLPIFIIRGEVLVPYTQFRLQISDPVSLKTFFNAKFNDDCSNKILVVTKRTECYGENLKYSDIFDVGVIAEVRSVTMVVKNKVDIVIEAQSRVRLVQPDDYEYINYESTKYIDLPSKNAGKPTDFNDETLKRALFLASKAVEYLPSKTRGFKYKRAVYDMFEYDRDILSFALIGNTSTYYRAKQFFMEIDDSVTRLSEIVKYININNRFLIDRGFKELDETCVNEEDQGSNLKANRIKAINYKINKELDKIVDESSRYKIAQNYRNKISELTIDSYTKKCMLDVCDQILLTNEGSESFMTYVKCVNEFLKIPWNQYTEESIDLDKVKEILDKNHYGLENIKETILDFIAVIKFNPVVKGRVICLVGPPGVGKTSIVKSIAKAIGRNYAKISLSSVSRGDDLKGIEKLYISARPGLIIKAIEEAKSFNPIILLDEIDKIGTSTYNGDARAVLLELLDPSQNSSFYDNYFGFPIDLSSVMFIATANYYNDIPKALLDRMDIIKLGSYTYEEKFHIAKDHIIKKQAELTGIKYKKIEFTDDAIRYIIKGYTREAGVRMLEQKFKTISRKAAIELLEGKTKITVDKNKVNEYIKYPIYTDDLLSMSNQVGVVNGLAWTSVGGALLEHEAAVFDGTGKLELTGSLGDVMKESAKVALGYIRSKTDKFKIDKNFYKTKDIHIHCPEEAVPKDGPSAGVTMVTALVSALTNIPVKSEVAMTGEITIHGKVLAIGGLKEKAMGAYINGIKTIIFPKDNIPDLYNVDSIVKENIEFIPVENVDEVLNIALERMP